MYLEFGSGRASGSTISQVTIMRYVVKLTMDQAKALGIVVCKHCGWPPNNHFDFTFNGKKMPCAHDNTCPGYEARFRTGKAIE